MAQVMTWDEVVASPGYRKLSPDQRKAAQQEYFDDVVAPQVPAEQIEAARSEFLADTTPETKLGFMGQVADAGKQVGRQLGLTTRAAVTGATALPNMVGDAVYGGINAAGRAVGLDPGLPMPSQSTQRHLSGVGLPEPANATERVARDVVGGMAGAATTMGIGAAAAPASKLGLTLKDIFTKAPTAQIASGAGGGAGGGMAREAGAGPLGQIAAGMAGAMAPAMLANVGPAVTKGAMGTVDPALAQAFRDAGTEPTVSQATGNRRTQATESMLAKAPGSAGVMARKGTEQQAEIGARTSDIAENLSPRADATAAGNAVSKGFWEGWLPQWKAKQGSLYSEVEQKIPPTYAASVANTQATLNRLTAPIPGATATSKLLANDRLGSIREALDADAQGGALPYQALSALRSRVGDLLESSEIIADAPRKQLKQLYGAITTDMKAAAQANGPEAEMAFDRANRYTRAGHDRIDMISNTVNKDGEAITQSALSGTKEGATKLRALMRSIPEESRAPLQAYVIKKLGKATSGRQNAEGDQFSTETFLTNWNNISPEAKMQLFTDDATRKGLDAVAKAAETIRAGSKVFSNPSGTAPALTAQMGAGGAILSLLLGRPEIAGGIAGTMGVANLSARLMTNPRFVQWLGTANKVPVEQIPAQLNALANSTQEKQDMQDLQDMVSAAPEKSTAKGTVYLKPLPAPGSKQWKRDEQGFTLQAREQAPARLERGDIQFFQKYLPYLRNYGMKDDDRGSWVAAINDRIQKDKVGGAVGKTTRYELGPNGELVTGK